MTIETKFKVDDTCYTIIDRKIETGKVYLVKVEVGGLLLINNKPETSVSYIISLSKNYSPNKITIQEKYLFATKQELLDSL